MKRDMHILMTADTLGGVWSYSMELISSLSPFNLQFTLVTMGKKLDENQQMEVKSLNNVQLVETTYKLEWMEDCRQDVEESGELLLKLEKELKPDLIHLNGYSHGSIGFTAPVIVVAHSCIFSWWQAVKNETPPVEYHHYYTNVCKGIASADYVVAPTSTMLRSLNFYYGNCRGQEVIPNGIKKIGYRGVKKQNKLLTIGRFWDEAKNIRILEKISHKLEWPVHAFGDNIHPVNRQSINLQNIRFEGKTGRQKILNELSVAAMYVLPAKYEPFGLSVLEAALSGCCLVLGDIPSLRENWYGAAVFVKPDDADALAAKINELAGDKQKREILAVNARHRAQKFTAEAMASNYIKLYQKACKQEIYPNKPKTIEYKTIRPQSDL